MTDCPPQDTSGIGSYKGSLHLFGKSTIVLPDYQSDEKGLITIVPRLIRNGTKEDSSFFLLRRFAQVGPSRVLISLWFAKGVLEFFVASA